MDGTHAYELEEQCQIPFVLLCTCYACNYSENCVDLGSTYVFGTSRGLAAIGCTKACAFIGSGMHLTVGDFYECIDNGAFISQALMLWRDSRLAMFGASHPVPAFLVDQLWSSAIIGDPTLVPNMHW